MIFIIIIIIIVQVQWMKCFNHNSNRYQSSPGFGWGSCRFPPSPRPCLTPPLHCHAQHRCHHLAEGAGTGTRPLSWHDFFPCHRFPRIHLRWAAVRGRGWERGNDACDVSSCSSLRNEMRSVDSAMDSDSHCGPSYENSCKKMVQVRKNKKTIV